MPATWTCTRQFEQALSQYLPAKATQAFAADSTQHPKDYVMENSTDASRDSVAHCDTGASTSVGAWAIVERSPWLALGLRCWRGLRTRFASGTPQAVRRHSMQVLSNLALGGRKTITLIQVDGQRYLVGSGAESVTSMVPLRSDDLASEVSPSHDLSQQSFTPESHPQKQLFLQERL